MATTIGVLGGVKPLLLTAGLTGKEEPPDLRTLGLTTLGLTAGFLLTANALFLGFKAAAVLLNAFPAAFFKLLAVFATPVFNLSAALPTSSVVAASLSSAAAKISVE